MGINVRGKRLFSLAVLFLLVLLSAGTLIFADGSGGSYSLIIEKIINEAEFGNDQSAFQEALQQEYTFNVRGEVLSDGAYKPFEETIKVNGNQKVEISKENIFSASVVEMTDNSNVNVPGWQMSTSDFLSTMFVREREAIFSINKPGGQISISKPSNLEDEPQRTYTYWIHSANQETAELSEVVYIKNGETQTVDNLPVGEYKIEEVRTREGFDLDISHTMSVAAGEEAKINFAGDYGKLKLTPPEDGLPHTYELFRGSYSYTETWQPGDEPHLIRAPLTQGNYNVREVIYEGFEGFEVSSPRTSDEVTFTSTKFGKDQIFNIPDGVNTQGNGVRVGFRNANGLAAGTKYNVKLTGLWGDEAAERTRSVNFMAYGDSSIAYMNVPYLVSDTLRINVGKTSGLTKTTLRLNYPAMAMVTEKSNGSSLIKQAGNLKQLIISKPADENPWGDKVLYHYTVTGTNYKKEFVLHAGESITLDGLTWGYNYTITETIEPPKPAEGFTLEVHDSANTSYTGSSLYAEIINETGSFVVSKPAINAPEHQDGRIYYYTLLKPDGSEEQFELKAGESQTFGPGLATGGYTVQSVKDTNLGFQISYNDSCMVSVLKGGVPSTVKVTNHFTQEIGGYYVVHEYYPSQDLVGVTKDIAERSHIFARGGKKLDDTHYTANDVELIFNGPSGQEYIYCDAVYGTTSGGHKTEVASQNLANGTYGVSADVYNLLPDAQRINNNPYIIGSDANIAKREAAGEPVDKNITYTVDSNMNYVVALPDTVDQEIIILRYYQAPPKQGKYKVVHAYFLRTPQGDVREGFSPIETVDGLLLDGTHYDVNGVERQPKHEWKGTEYNYTYFEGLYGRIVSQSEIDDIISAGGDVDEATLRYGYQPDSTKQWVVATEKGDQVIILRYYRTLPEKGAYKYVHEYYLRNADGSVVLEGKSGIGTVAQLELNDTKYTVGNVAKQPVYGAFTYTYEEAAYGKMTGDSAYAAAGDMEWVNATQAGDQVIILRYYREGVEPPPGPGPGPGPSPGPGPEEPEQPEQPEQPELPEEPEDSGDSSEPEPEEPEKPAPEEPQQPELTQTEEPPTETPVEEPKPELPNPNDPGSPERITFEGKTYVKVWDEEQEEWVYLPEDEVPLVGQEAPKTGDESKLWLWGLLCVAALAGLAMLFLKKPGNKQD